MPLLQVGDSPQIQHIEPRSQSFLRPSSLAHLLGPNSTANPRMRKVRACCWPLYRPAPYRHRPLDELLRHLLHPLLGGVRIKRSLLVAAQPRRIIPHVLRDLHRAESGRTWSRSKRRVGKGAQRRAHASTLRSYQTILSCRRPNLWAGYLPPRSGENCCAANRQRASRVCV
jgi:hypothetical protein